jgi:very-short-patch-repair endonuclease
MRALYPPQHPNLSDPGTRAPERTIAPTTAMAAHPMRSGQNPNRARILCRNQTDVERRLWRLLRDRRLEGFKFRRQQSIGPYFADFACIDKRLVVEADGGQHSDRAGYDRARTHYLESCGYRVMRFWNHEVILAEEAVLEEILRMLRTQ